MTDQNTQFMAILTAVGEAKQANANALGIPWIITQMGVGDANGTEPTPSRLQTSLINERRRAPLNQLKVDPDNEAIIIAEQVIPENVGGWWIREIGLYDEDGDLVAVANCPPTFKPELSQGSGRTQVVRLNILVSSIENIQLKIDPSVVLATRNYVDLLTVRASQADAELGEENSKVMTSLRTHQAIQKAVGDLGQQTKVFTVPGVHHWAVPEVLRNGKRKARITVTGAGGAGSRIDGYAGGGGGSGATVIGTFSLSGIETIPVTVGEGGSPSSSGESGGRGGTSSVGTLISAMGGEGATAAGQGGSAGTGGAGGDIFAGSGGSSAASGTHSFFVSGAGGSSYWGGGGRSIGVVTTSAGYPGENGGGGGGSTGPNVAGRGGHGVVVIEW